MAFMINNFVHYYQKIKTVGVSRAARALYFRAHKVLYIRKMRKKMAGAIRERPNEQSVSHTSLNFLDELKIKIDQDHLIKQADRYVALRFDLLGSGEHVFKKMPWHEDIRLVSQNSRAHSLFDAKQFYADISIGEGSGKTVGKDIKLPWELSRFHHLPVLGLAYAQTGDMKYAQVAKEQITDWLDSNHYLFGVNWVCPMEVGIRATNWIVAWHWLYEPLHKDEQFHTRFVSSLRDHMEYLEGNWEFYDGRTSNHYLSNLVGYFYLCWFFGTAQKRDWCYRELLREFEWQVFDEGSSYEGSTRYHQLITELMVHTFLLAKEMDVNVEDAHVHKVERMLAFIDWCKPTAEGGIVAIGDDDSGSLLHKELFGLSTVASILFAKRGTFFGVKRYAQFGISISKADDWHVTLRHHAYDPRQPSGHFHEDAGSVTIAYKGIPIVVDPGSYLYTASSDWRNTFRSAAMHSSLYLPHSGSLNSPLFVLNIPENRCENSCHTGGLLRASCLISRDVRVEREIKIDEQECVITDYGAAHGDSLMKNFILSPDIMVQQDGATWVLLHNQDPILYLIFPSQTQVILQNAWVAPGYGHKLRTSCLSISHVDGEPTIFCAT